LFIAASDNEAPAYDIPSLIGTGCNVLF